MLVLYCWLLIRRVVLDLDFGGGRRLKIAKWRLSDVGAHGARRLLSLAVERNFRNFTSTFILCFYSGGERRSL
jgi:hypothetical protein